MATYTKIVDPNGGGDYTSLAAWVAGEQGLYTSSDVAEALCRRTGPAKDTTKVDVAGFVATPKITVDPAYRHEGVPADQRSDGNYIYVLDVQVTGSDCINLSNDGSSVNGLYVRAKGTSSYVAVGIRLDGTETCAINCLSEWGGPSTASSAIGICGDGTYTRVRYIVNCIAVGWAGAEGGVTFRGIQVNYPEAYVYNCTSYGDVGIWLSTLSIVKNCVAWGVTQGFYGSGAAGSDYNASNFGDAPGANSLNLSSYTEAQVFQDFANYDLRPSAGSPLIDAGVDLSSDPYYSVTDDIIGTARPQSTAYDIGAFEYIAAGGGVTYQVAGGADGVAGLTASAGLAEALYGAAAGLGGLSGALAAAAGLTGAAQALAGAAAESRGAAGLTGAVAGVAAASAAARLGEALGGLAAGLATLVGDLAESSAASLAGVAAALAQATGDAAARQALAGSAAGALTGTAEARLAEALTGAVTALAQAIGAATTGTVLDLGGTAAGLGAATAQAAVAAALDGDAAGLADLLDAVCRARARLEAAAQAAGAAGLDARLAAPLAGTVDALAQAAGTLVELGEALGLLTDPRLRDVTKRWHLHLARRWSLRDA